MIKDVKIFRDRLCIQVDGWTPVDIPVYREDIKFLMKKLHEFVDNDGLEDMPGRPFLYMSIDFYDYFSKEEFNRTYKIEHCNYYNKSTINEVLRKIKKCYIDFYMDEYCNGSQTIYEFNTSLDFRRLIVKFYNTDKLPKDCNLVNRSIIEIENISKIIREQLKEMDVYDEYSIFLYKRNSENDAFKVTELKVDDLNTELIRSLITKTPHFYRGCLPDLDNLDSRQRRIIIVMGGKFNLERFRSMIDPSKYTVKDYRKGTTNDNTLLQEVINILNRKG